MISPPAALPFPATVVTGGAGVPKGELRHSLGAGAGVRDLGWHLPGIGTNMSHGGQEEAGGKEGFTSQIPSGFYQGADLSPRPKTRGCARARNVSWRLLFPPPHSTRISVSVPVPLLLRNRFQVRTENIRSPCPPTHTPLSTLLQAQSTPETSFFAVRQPHWAHSCLMTDLWSLGQEISSLFPF